ncbi:MAG: DUF3667 domain-containing protein [Bacteroidota bacterium]
MEQLTHTCKSCGNQFTGLYCNLCGEKVILPKDRSFSTLMGSILVAITFADNKSVKTMWSVLRNPGFVSGEFAEGRTVRYLKPMSLFFVLNLVYFLFPLIQLFNATWVTQLGTVYGTLVLKLSLLKMNALHLPRNAFELMYNEKSVGYAKMLVIVFAVLASLPLNLLYRKSTKFFSDHVGLMIELACFNLFANALVVTLLAKLLPIGGYLNETVLTVLFIITNMYFLVRSSATFYGEQGWRLVAKSLVMLGFLKVALEAYRLVLFLVTIWSM